MLYDYQCKKCLAETEAVNRIDERNTNAPMCCGERMSIVIKHAPMGYMGRNIDYVCPVTNKHVTSKRQRREIMAREGLVSAHEMVSSKAERQKQVERSQELSRLSKETPDKITQHVEQWAKQSADV